MLIDNFPKLEFPSRRVTVNISVSAEIKCAAEAEQFETACSQAATTLAPYAAPTVVFQTD